MKRAATVALALGAVIGAGLTPATAQVVIGGSGEPDVLVNWSVIDRLGPAPTLAEMLKADIPGIRGRASVSPSGAKPETITFRPFAEPKKKVARKAAPVAAKAVPAPQPSPAIAELTKAAKAEAQAASASEPATAPTAVAKAEPAPPVPPKPDLAKPELPPAKAEPAVAAQPVPPKVVVVAETPVSETPKTILAKADTVPATPEPAKVIAKVPEPAPALLVKAEPVMTPAPAPEPIPEVASLPASAAAVPSVVASGDTLSIRFVGEASRMPDASRAELGRLAARLEKDEGLGLQLLAYADGDDASASKARRLSLSRALEVRKYLMEQGVRSTRIEVRALGNKSDGGPADRVDAILVAR